ncbi:AAA family ATPase [Hyphomicrobium sp.]|uniref:AAA family ATPase n=1 Tax=Hyphomicrobium sp. TaxID=82 RepID=UPI002FDDEBE2
MLDTITARDLLAKKIASVPMIINDIVPAGLTVFAGKPKIGKSWFALNAALAVASGERFLDRDIASGDVLYLALEDTQARLQSRVRTILGEGGDAPDTLALATGCPPLDKGGDAAIRGWIRKADRPRLIVVDVLQKIRGDDKKVSAYQADYAALEPLKVIADEFGIAVVAITHTRKMEALGDRFDTVSATTGLTGAADHVVILDRVPDGLVLYGRGRDIDEFDFALSFDGKTGRFEDAGNPEDRARSDSRRRIMDALKAASAPIGPNEIAAASGVAPNVVRQHLPRMMQAGEVEKLGRGKYVTTRQPMAA